MKESKLNFENIYTLFCMYNLGKGAGDKWTTWPVYELMDSPLPTSLHYWETMSEDERVIANHWFSLFKFIHDSNSISISGNVLYITGRFGHQFSAFIDVAHETWRSASGISSKETITHNLGPFWKWPEHLDFGGTYAQLEADPWIETQSFEGPFPTRILKLITACIDDEEIWNHAYNMHLRNYKYKLWRILEFSNGIPEDYTSDMAIPPAEFASWTIAQLEKAKTITELETMTQNSTPPAGGEE